MNVIFNAAAALISFLSLSIYPMDCTAQEFEAITWAKESRDGSCVKFHFEMPASLVPIYQAGTPSAAGYWESFDADFKFLYTENAMHLELTRLSKQSYLSKGRCTDFAIKASKCWQADHLPAKLYQMTGPRDWTGADAKNAACMNIDAVAPTGNDRSRFGVRLQFCGPSSKKNLVELIAMKTMRSVEYSYQGCCKGGNSNISGCKDLR
jgi:hypothetical protein